MIPINESYKLQMPSSPNRSDILDKYFNHIAFRYYNSKNGFVGDAKILNDWCASNLLIQGKSYSFKEIVLADYKTLIKVKTHLDHNGHIALGKDEVAAISRLYEERIDRVKYIKSLDITVCPYCNRNYINSTQDRTMCQFDHFFNKSEYPLFYVSFFNLVPVCQSCNHIKGKASFGYSPHDIDYTVNELTTFLIKLKGANMLDPSNIDIEILPHKVMTENILKLHLVELYQIHTDIVTELYKKSQICNDTFIDMIYKSYKSLFSSKAEVKQLFIGTYIDEKEYQKRPLSKMVNDISKFFRIL